MDELTPPGRASPTRRGIQTALVATAVAVAVIAIDSFAADDADPSPDVPPASLARPVTYSVPASRAVTGPPKGVSVVSSSTTSSTLPIVVTTAIGTSRARP